MTGLGLDVSVGIGECLESFLALLAVEWVLVADDDVPGQRFGVKLWRMFRTSGAAYQIREESSMDALLVVDVIALVVIAFVTIVFALHVPPQNDLGGRPHDIFDDLHGPIE